MDDKIWLCIIGIICVTIMEVAALITRLDGLYFGTAVGAVTTIIGFAFGYTLKAYRKG